jgi:hypothetical protein
MSPTLPVLLLSSSLFAFSFFPNATLKRVDPAFSLETLSGKRIVCVDSAVAKNGWLVGELGLSSVVGLYSSILPDFDGIYGRGVFDSTYVPASLYTGPFISSLCDIVADRQKASRLPDPTPADSAASLPTPDYRVVLRTIKFHQRLNLQTVLSIDDGASGKTLAYIRIDAEDKFGFGGRKRFQKAFENLKETTIKNLGKDFGNLLTVPTGNRSTE